MSCLGLSGEPAAAGDGGPDALGYTWFDVNAGCPVQADAFLLANSASFLDTGLLNFVGPFDIGFQFPFYDRITTSVWVHRSGLIFFEPPPDNDLLVPSGIPAVDAAGGFLAAYWDEQVDGALSRASVVSHEAFPGYFKISIDTELARNLAPLRLEVYLYPGGDIRVEYLDPNRSPFLGSVGIESPDQTTGLEVLAGGTASGGLTFPSPTPFSICYDRPGQLACGTAETVTCGTLSGSSPVSLPQAVALYSCSPTAYNGNEKIYEIVLDSVSDLDVTLTAGNGMVLFLLDGCDEFHCLDGDSAVVQGRTLAPGRYFIVVEAERPQNEGPFTLDIQCRPLSQPIRCEEAISDSTSGGTSRMNGYGCLAGDFGGAEDFYLVDFAPPGNLNVSLDSATGHAAFVAAWEGPQSTTRPPDRT
jgi:hypothetical protein